MYDMCPQCGGRRLDLDAAEKYERLQAENNDLLNEVQALTDENERLKEELVREKRESKEGWRRWKLLRDRP